MYNKKFIKRFHTKYTKTENCWNWIGYKHKLGYGQIKFENKLLSGPRVAWEIAYGKNYKRIICFT